jgi:hypothetical protein
MAHLVYSESMGLIDVDFTVAGNMVLDAGTKGRLSHDVLPSLTFVSSPSKAMIILMSFCSLMASCLLSQ